ncbi:MAG: phosphatidate cytidylyltransferase [Candidatus Cryptobacteroides sp.]|jgi:phosphatidate cytidylyltransferase|nr:phosphatidate cytidylyltransferase [Bacteroidales bacterium]MDD7088613.1 phosphatidate cytidylyltransferase [Bacteroidales bacterium]MDY2936046.1 phosphatidate cytidylyltransferase [Candidatus Cryptobacteroides sp.]MEE3390220.1 phosphatidate cytidylyltransferase [Candidatus Cryptobacteroides sp.]
MNNTTVRAISGTVFVILMVLCLSFNKFLFAAMVITIMVFMLLEYYRISMGNSYAFSKVLAILSAVFLFVLLFVMQAYHLQLRFVALAMVPVFIVMINSIYLKDKSEYDKLSNIYTGLLYIAIPLALSNLIAFDKAGNFSGLLLIDFFVIIWCSDVGAFTFGKLLGKKFPKKLFESVSPHKTWVGFFGGLFSSVLAAFVLYETGILRFPLIHCLILSVIMSVAGVYGDLFESQWKRFYGVKDSGNIIPGHGGMLDRFDSTLMAMPFGAIYLAIFDLL